MASFNCKMCGGTIDYNASDRVITCEYCGCKYSIEEAKKSLQDGVADNNYDNSIKLNPELENLYSLARRAKENDDEALAAKYYEQITLQNPDDWEAVFFASFFRFQSIKIAEIRSTVSKFHNLSISVLDIIKKNALKIPDVSSAISEITYEYFELMEMLYSNSYKHYGNKLCTNEPREDFERDDCIEYLSTHKEIAYSAIAFGDKIDKIFPEEHNQAIECWKFGSEYLYYWIKFENAYMPLTERHKFNRKWSNSGNYKESDFEESNIEELVAIKDFLKYYEKIVETCGELDEEIVEQKNKLLEYQNKVVISINNYKQEWLREKSSLINNEKEKNDIHNGQGNKVSVACIVWGLILLIGGINIGGFLEIAFLVYAAIGDNDAFFCFVFGTVFIVLGLIFGIKLLKKAKRKQ